MSDAIARKCPNCSSELSHIGMSVFRMGRINGAVSLLVFPDIGMEVPLDVYACEKCGKVELYSDEQSRKLMKGEYPGDYFKHCANEKCGKKFSKDYTSCPYCGTATAKQNHA